MRKLSPYVVALFLIACGGESEQGNIPPPAGGGSSDDDEVETYRDKPTYEQVSWDFGGDDDSLDPPAMGRMIAEATGGEDELILHMAGSLGTAAYLEPTNEDGTKWSVEFGTWFIDPDGDESTGFPAKSATGETTGSPGFAYAILARLAGGDDGGSADFELRKLTDGGPGEMASADGGEPSFDDERVTVRIPYSALGVEAGDTIRLCFIARTTESEGEQVVGEVRTMELP